MMRRFIRESTERCKPGLTLAFGAGQTYFGGQTGSKMELSDYSKGSTYYGENRKV